MKKLALIPFLIALIIPFVMAHADEKKTQGYAIGDRGPAGGIIFYDKGNINGGWRYLEAAPADTSAGTKWWNGQYKFIADTKTYIGAGRSNTWKIVSAQGEGSYAAKLCADYRGGGKNDWFLPSKDELTEMRICLSKISANELSGEYYWSSSQIDGSIAWINGIDNQDGSDKDFSACVRAIRAFK